MLKNYSICKIACLIVIIITLFFLSAVTSLAIEKETEYIFATGPMGGTFYPLGGIISQTWNEKIDDVSITAIVTAAGLENLRLLKDNEAAFAILPESISYFGYTETGICEDLGEKFDNFSVLAKAYPEPIQIVVRKNSDFKSIVDLKGKKVAMGMKGGFQHIFGMQIFEYAGLSTKDFKPSFLGYTAAADQFVDNMIDGIFGYTGLPNSTFMQLSISPKIKLIPIDESTIEKLKEGEYPFATKMTIPDDAYPSLEKETQTVSIWALILVRNDLSEDLVYKFTKELFENSSEMAKSNAQAKWIDVKYQKDLSLPIHPGAKKYYEEKTK
jgi:uncharacterized protein